MHYTICSGLHRVGVCWQQSLWNLKKWKFVVMVRKLLLQMLQPLVDLCQQIILLLNMWSQHLLPLIPLHCLQFQLRGFLPHLPSPLLPGRGPLCQASKVYLLPFILVCIVHSSHWSWGLSLSNSCILGLNEYTCCRMWTGLIWTWHVHPMIDQPDITHVRKDRVQWLMKCWSIITSAWGWLIGVGGIGLKKILKLSPSPQ